MNKIVLRIPVTTYQEVTLSKGMRTALHALLFPSYPQENKPQKVAAIKALRQELNCGLREAKDLVDSLTPQILDEDKEVAPYYENETDFVSTLGGILARADQRR